MSHRTSAIKTVVPLYVVWRLLVLVVILGATLIWLFGLLWGSVLTLVMLACIRPYFTVYVHPFTARLVLDGFTKEIRCLRRGLNWTAPAETLGVTLNLKKDIDGVPKETYPSKAGQVVTEYMYAMAPDSSSDKALIRYESYEDGEIGTAGEALFGMMLSDYFRDKEKDEDILDKEKINQQLFSATKIDGKIVFKDQRLNDFTEKHGVIIEEIRLKDVDFDEEMQKARDVISKATSFTEAVDHLVKTGTKRDKAENIIRQLMNLPGFKEHLINLEAKGVENLTHFSMVGGLGGDDNKKGGKK